MKKQIPTFKGVKFSDRDLLDLRQCVQKSEQGSFMFLYGVDEVRVLYRKLLTIVDTGWLPLRT